MNLTIDSKELAAGVISVAKALPARASMPILEGIYLQATSDGLRLKCTDMMLQKECTVEADVSEDGYAVVTGKLFSELVRKIPDGEVTIRLDGETLFISCGRFSSSVQCLSDSGNYPDMQFNGDSFSVKIDSDKCAKMINETVFATSTEESKPVLTGVLIELGSEISFVATDAFQFAKRSMAMQSPSEERSMIVPSKSMVEIARMMDAVSGDAELTFTKTHVSVSVGSERLIARLLDGNYIKYQNILPKDHNTRVCLDKRELIDSIDRAQLMARDGSNNILMKIEDDKVVISANSHAGKVSEEVDAQKAGDDIDIAFNPRFLMNVLKNIPDDKVYMDFTTSVAPCVIKPAKTDGFYYLIVPVRIYQN
jgi:DNA polymerase-3 subunit beta